MKFRDERLNIDSNEDNLLLWLQGWYVELCNGDWEHQYGVVISTLDNPGWLLTVDLYETVFEGKSFMTIDETGRSDTDWIYCKVENGSFQGAGGPHNLVEILRVFRNWVEEEGGYS